MNSPPVAAAPVRSSLDLVGIVLSVLCVIHCLALPLVATGALAWAASESVHLGLALALGAVVLLVALPGYRRHRRVLVPVLLVAGVVLLVGAVLVGEALGEAGETTLTLLGSATLVVGHLLNLRLPNVHA
ncbi:MAG: MerC domain-containing protein [Bacteroidota bacterium]